MNKNKQKTCKSCKVKFITAKPLQSVCGFECSITYAKTLTEKNNASNAVKYRKELAIRKEKLKSKSEYLKEAQRFFNIYIRKRDEKLPCISCGTTNPNVQYAAGHYRTVGSHPELRFNELNVNKQCNHYCNSQLSGNILEYRKGLIEKIGIDNVNWLEGKHEPLHLSIEDVKAIKVKYKILIKELENEK